jgi:coenzyme F420-reducing hydrogenase beta subunit
MILITKKQNCSGCKACYNICPEKCIEMFIDEEGFWYPKANEDKCIQCGLCEKVCPEINIYHNDKSYDKPTCLAAWNNDKSKREDSSSGGVFTSIAEWILSNEGVVFGAGYDSGFNVIHKETYKMEGLSELRGSKYVQSDINDTYNKAKQCLDKGEKVLFTGTPCQIAGLYNFLQKEYAELYTCDLVCHGVPSPIVFKKYKQNLECQYNSNIKTIAFRNKNY